MKESQSPGGELLGAVVGIPGHEGGDTGRVKGRINRQFEDAGGSGVEGCRLPGIDLLLPDPVDDGIGIPDGEGYRLIGLVAGSRR